MQPNVPERLNIADYWPNYAYEDFVLNLDRSIYTNSTPFFPFKEGQRIEDVFYRVRWGYLDRTGHIYETEGTKVFVSMKKVSAFLDDFWWILGDSEKGLKFIIVDISVDGGNAYKHRLLWLHQMPELEPMPR